jgi:hypothetical protein
MYAKNTGACDFETALLHVHDCRVNSSAMQKGCSHEVQAQGQLVYSRLIESNTNGIDCGCTSMFVSMQRTLWLHVQCVLPLTQSAFADNQTRA